MVEQAEEVDEVSSGRRRCFDFSRCPEAPEVEEEMARIGGGRERRGEGRRDAGRPVIAP